MKLKRATEAKHLPGYDSVGHWESACGRWMFIRRTNGWTVDATIQFMLTPEGDADVALILSTGLQGPFKTRRAAIAALSAALAGQKAAA